MFIIRLYVKWRKSEFECHNDRICPANASVCETICGANTSVCETDKLDNLAVKRQMRYTNTVPKCKYLKMQIRRSGFVQYRI